MKAASFFLFGAAVSFAHAGDIDFNDLKRPGPPLVRTYTVIGAGSDGQTAISRFGEIDTSRVAERQRNPVEAPQQASASSSSSSGGRSSGGESGKSSAPTNSVKSAYDAGTKSSKGFRIYRIVCSNGNARSAFQDGSGRWFDDGGASFSDRYRGMSLSDFASTGCKNGF